MDLTEQIYAAWKAGAITLRDIVEYRSWQGMMRRCYNSNHVDYANYGGRGIVVCARWLPRFDGFWLFVHDVGLRPGPGYSIDRMHNDGPYCPENCSWATKLQQAANTRQINQWADYRAGLRLSPFPLDRFR